MAAQMQDERTTLQWLQKLIDTIIIEQWVMMHLDHPQNIQYIRPERPRAAPTARKASSQERALWGW